MTDMDPGKSVLVNNSTIEEWSDRRCFGIARLDTFPEIVKDTNIQKKIISRFLNFYLGGKCQKGLSAIDLIYAVISIMPASLNSEEFIWDDDHYSEQGTLFFLTPDDKLKFDIANVINKTEDKVKEIPSENEEIASEKLIDVHSADEQVKHEIDGEPELCNNEEQESIKNKETIGESQDRDHSGEEEANSCTDINVTCKSENDSTDEGSSEKPSKTMDLQWFRQKYDVKLNVTSEEYSPVSNAAFCINCNRLLDQWESDLKARNSLKYFFAMTALIVMRCRVKTYQNITKYFSTSFFRNIYPNEIVSYTPPHRGFIKKSWKALHESDVRTQIMFAKLVINALSEREKMNVYGKRNIFIFAILSHTANYGMGIISMLQLLAAKSYDFDTVFESIHSEDVAASWNAVNDFFKKYLCKSVNQHTFHWARIIESEQFEYLSCSNNYGFAVVIAVFIEKVTDDSGIWRSAWVDNEYLDTYKQLGLKMYKSYQTNKESKLTMQFIRPEIMEIIKSLISDQEKKNMDSI